MTIGFVENQTAGDAAKRFQKTANRPLSNAERRKWHIRSYYCRKEGDKRSADLIDQMLDRGRYNKPKRAFIKPFSGVMRRDGVRIIEGRIRAIHKRTKGA